MIYYLSNSSIQTGVIGSCLWFPEKLYVKQSQKSCLVGFWAFSLLTLFDYFLFNCFSYLFPQFFSPFLCWFKLCKNLLILCCLILSSLSISSLMERKSWVLVLSSPFFSTLSLFPPKEKVDWPDSFKQCFAVSFAFFYAKQKQVFLNNVFTFS